MSTDQTESHNQDHVFARWLRYIVRMIVAVSFGYFLLVGDWTSGFYTALIFMSMSVPAVLSERYRLHLPAQLDAGIVCFLFLALFLGALNDFYDLIPFWDSALHFQSGILLGVFGFVLAYVLHTQKIKQITLTPGFVALFAICFAISVGALWEIYEFFVDRYLGYEMQAGDLDDTMTDLIVDTLGALLVGLWGYGWLKNNWRVPFESNESLYE